MALARHQRVLAVQLAALGPAHLHTTQAQVNVAMELRINERCVEAGRCSRPRGPRA